MNTLDYMNAWGTLLSGIGTMLLAISAIYTVISYSRWREEKIREKKGQLAGETLDLLESSIVGIQQWLLSATTWLLYRRQTLASQSNFHLLDEDERKKLNKQWNEDPYEISNFCRSFQLYLTEFNSAKNRAARLNEDPVTQYFSKLEPLLKVLPAKVMRLHQPNFPLKEQEITREYLQDKAGLAIEEIIVPLKAILLDRIHLKK